MIGGPALGIAVLQVSSSGLSLVIFFLSFDSTRNPDNVSQLRLTLNNMTLSFRNSLIDHEESIKENNDCGASLNLKRLGRCFR